MSFPALPIRFTPAALFATGTAVAALVAACFIAVGRAALREVPVYDGTPEASHLRRPTVFWLAALFLGVFSGPGSGTYLRRLGLIWLALSFIGLIFRTVWLCITRNVQTGLVWFTKILTDPFHDVKMYHKAPLFLLKGQWLDPMEHVQDLH